MLAVRQRLCSCMPDHSSTTNCIQCKCQKLMFYGWHMHFFSCRLMPIQPAFLRTIKAHVLQLPCHPSHVLCLPEAMFVTQQPPVLQPDRQLMHLTTCQTST